MGSFQNPVGGGPKDPFEKYRIEEIQKDKDSKENEKKASWAEHPRLSFIAAYLLHIFKKFLEIFERTNEKSPESSTKIDVKEHLILLKAALDTLKMQDLSQDVVFLSRLSALWHQILEDLLHFRRTMPFAEKMRSFIKAIQEFPENQEHTLGYYLLEYAGEKWIPFPYMEILRRLWAEHQKNPVNSHLFEWGEDLDDMIRFLSSS